ncbi:MAG: GAF domain-containing protein, partial [Anaerolineales bacterium]
GLSTKDLLAALNAQGLDIPLIVLANEAEEGDILAAFRLGAVDFLLMPSRETEILRVVERALIQVRLRMEVQKLNATLISMQAEYQGLLNCFRILIEIGKLVHGTSDIHRLLSLFLQRLIPLINAERGMICLSKDGYTPLYLVAMENMPAELNAQQNKVWEDGLSSHWENFEALHIYGESLKPFILSNYGQVALIVPIHFRTELLGSLILLRTQNIPFEPSQRQLASFLADYLASILMIYRLSSSQKEIVISEELQQADSTEIRDSVKQHILDAYETTLAMLSEEGMLLSNKQRKMLYQINDNLQAILTEIPPFTSRPEANDD